MVQWLSVTQSVTCTCQPPRPSASQPSAYLSSTFSTYNLHLHLETRSHEHALPHMHVHARSRARCFSLSLSISHEHTRVYCDTHATLYVYEHNLRANLQPTIPNLRRFFRRPLKQHGTSFLIVHTVRATFPTSALSQCFFLTEYFHAL